MRGIPLSAVSRDCPSSIRVVQRWRISASPTFAEFHMAAVSRIPHFYTPVLICRPQYGPPYALGVCRPSGGLALSIFSVPALASRFPYGPVRKRDPRRRGGFAFFAFQLTGVWYWAACIDRTAGWSIY